jgi:hypothetical protein
MLAEGGLSSSPGVGANVGHLFSNVVDQENKATQLLIITDLRLPKHYLHMGIMLIRRR